MPDDLDFSEEAMLEYFERNSQRAQDTRKIVEWMREPDHVSKFSLGWMVEWLERRPLAEMTRVCDYATACDRRNTPKSEPNLKSSTVFDV